MASTLSARQPSAEETAAPAKAATAFHGRRRKRPPSVASPRRCATSPSSSRPPALRLNGERGVRIVGTDMSPQAVGRHFCDRFYVVPPGHDAAFGDALLDVVRRENIDAVLPQSSHDLQGLADARERFMGTTVMVSPPEAIRTANDKAATYTLLERLGRRAPASRRVSGSRAHALPAGGHAYP